MSDETFLSDKHVTDGHTPGTKVGQNSVFAVFYRCVLKQVMWLSGPLECTTCSNCRHL